MMAGKSDEQADVGTGSHTSVATGSDTREVEHGEEEIDFDDEKLLDGISQPVVMVGRAGDILAWNAGMEALTGVDRDSVDDADDARRALYGAGERSQLVAEMVLQAPDAADQQFDLTSVNRDLNIYETTVTTETAGNVRWFDISARPLATEETGIAAVVQTVQERTEERRRQRAIDALVSELSATIARLEGGELDARASLSEEHTVLDDETLAVVDRLNEMASAFESVTEQVDEQATAFEKTVEESVRTAEHIEERVDEQAELLATVTEETTSFSATMEEVAASTDDVASAAQTARDAAERGRDAGAEVDDAVGDVIETSDELVETVRELDEQMEEIGAVVEIINDIADQTNMLALNANIEAARAGEAGEGFAVVADEIKDLADTTGDHASDIVDRIDALRETSDQALGAARRSDENLQAARADIDDVLDSLDDIAESVDEAASGITEIADVTDDQAASIEEVQSLVEETDDHSAEVARASADIAEAIREQQSAITALSARVDELTGRET